MARIALILVLVAGVYGSGCVTNRRPAAALYQKSLLVTNGMTEAEVYAVITAPPPVLSIGTVDGKHLISWHSGTSLGDEDYTMVDVLLGKDGRVENVDRETGHGHEPHDLMTWP